MLNDMHFKCVALTPALGSHEETSYSEEDLDEYFRKYDELVETFLEKLRKGEEFNIYPFVSEVDAVSKGIKRIYGCGSGLGFASVDIKGNIYPCMRFIGNEDYIIGHVETGLTIDDRCFMTEPCITDQSVKIVGQGTFAEAHVLRYRLNVVNH